MGEDLHPEADEGITEGQICHVVRIETEIEIRMMEVKKMLGSLHREVNAIGHLMEANEIGGYEWEKICSVLDIREMDPDTEWDMRKSRGRRLRRRWGKTRMVTPM